MAFDWKKTMQEVSGLRDDISRAKRFYKILSDVDMELLTKSEALAQTIGGAEAAHDAVAAETESMKAALAKLETKYKATKAQVEKDVPAWEAEIVQAHARMVADTDALAEEYAARESLLRAELEQKVKGMEADVLAAKNEAEALIEGYAKQTTAAEKQLANVRRLMADLASSAQGV